MLTISRPLEIDQKRSADETMARGLMMEKGKETGQARGKEEGNGVMKKSRKR